MSMERRLLLAVLLSVVIMVAWRALFPPAAPPRPETPAEEVSAETAAGPPTGMEEGAPPEPLPLEAQGPSVGEEEARVVTVETDEALVMLTNRGGRVLSWKLTGYKDDRGRNLELVPERARTADRLPLGLILEEEEFQEAANGALYRVERLDETGRPAVAMTWSDGAGREVRKVLRLRPGFEAAVELTVRRQGRPTPAGVFWGAGFGEEGDRRGATFAYSGRAIVEAAPKPLRRAADDVEPGGILSTGTGRRWGGLEDTYFAALFLPRPEGRFSVRAVEVPATEGEAGEQALLVALEMAGDGSATDLYIGPKDYQLLAAKERNLQEVVHFQSAIWVIGPVVTLLTRGLFHSLIFLHQTVVSNWGWAIVLLTVIIKLLFWPITQKSMLSMKRMQEKTKRLQPKIAAIKEKYRRQGKKDIDGRQKMNQEIMGLYQKEGINPMGNLGGCLPLLLQLPILYGFYNLLQVAIELRQAPFMLWVQDLSQADPYKVLPIVMGASMVIQQVLTGAAIADPAQRRMMYLTPVLFTLFFLNLPAGLVLYWLVNNLLGILQQYLINRRYALEKVAVPARRAPAGRKA
jgi:YidC/Oxa1 family membrane protein insertase